MSAVDPIWKEIREDFPALSELTYLNSAATGPLPRPVTEAANRFYGELAKGGDTHWDAWRQRAEEVRAKVAAFVNAEADEIAFVPNTSTGMNIIVDLLGASGAVLSDELEFPSVTLPWIHRGIPVHVVPAIEGVLRIESFQAGYSPRAATIAISHVQFSNGCRQDLAAFGQIKSGRNLVVCGSQSLGAFPVDVKATDIDALATAGHKWLCAGYGAGFVYVSRRLIDAHPPRTVGWLSVEDPFSFDNRQVRLLPSARRFELGCPSFAPIFALGAAVEYLSKIGIERIAERVLYLNEYLTFRLQRKGLNVLSPGGENRSAQTLCEVPDPPAAAAFLREKGILVTPKPEGVRIATHFFNSEEEVESAVRALVEYVQVHSHP
jgi:cysteine desulfurase / selenocysteine lyase